MVRDRIRARHYSYRTEKTYLHSVRRFVRFHPRDLGAPEVERFVISLALDGKVSASTQNQALAALLFLYRDVLDIRLPWLGGVVRAKRPQRVPVVLSRQGVRELLARMSGTHWLVKSMLYGSGLRITKCLQLRVKDVDIATTSARCRSCWATRTSRRR